MAKDVTKLGVAGLSEKQAKAEHARLYAELLEHDNRYYQDDKPTVTDAEYDALRKRYGDIEERFPGLKTLESLTLKVGAAPTSRFAKVPHSVPMLSLDNAFSDEEVTRVRRPGPAVPQARCRRAGSDHRRAEDRRAELSLRYEKGKLVQRGDARRRRGRRGCHAECQDDQRHPADDQGQGHPRRRRGARRGLYVEGRFRRAE